MFQFWTDKAIQFVAKAFTRRNEVVWRNRNRPIVAWSPRGAWIGFEFETWQEAMEYASAAFLNPMPHYDHCTRDWFPDLQWQPGPTVSAN